MTAESITAEQHHIDCQYNGSDPNAESIRKPHRLPHIDRENDDESEREIKKIAVHVLHDERKGTLAEIGFARLAHGTGGRVGPKGFVIGASIVIASQPEPARRPHEKNPQRNQTPNTPPS